MTGTNPVFFSAYGIGAVGLGSSISSNAVATDAAGDTFLTGSFRGSAAFNPASPSTTITAGGTQDTFVAEYSPTGTLSWLKTFAGSPGAVSQGSSLAVDGSGDVFVAGGFTGTVTFGTTPLTSSGKTEAFVAKLGPTGTLGWVTPVTATAGAVDGATALALDSTGLPVIGGLFQGTATFGSHSVTAGGATDAFLAKLDSLGNFTWSKATQGSLGSDSEIHGLAVDASGDVIGVGKFTGSINVNPGGTAENVSSSLLATSDALIWKVDPSGNFGFVDNIGGLLGTTTANAVAVDPAGDIYTTGGFTGLTNLNLGSLVNGLLSSSSSSAYLMKLSPSGVQTWADGLVGQTGVATGDGVAVDPSGHIHVAGPFSGTIDFDPVGSVLNALTSQSSTDIFATGFDSAGNLLYKIQAGTSGTNGVNGVAVDPTGAVTVTGPYVGPITFGTTTLPSLGPVNDYVSKVFTSNAVPSTPSAPVLTAGSLTGSSTSITADTDPTFTVSTADAMDTVELLRNGTVVASRVGPGTIQDPGVVPDGTYTYTAVQVSPVNVPSLPSTGTTVTIDTATPAAPTGLTLLSSDDTGQPGYTSITSPHMIGSSIAGDTVELFSGPTMIGSAVAGSNGSFSIVPTSPLSAGSYTLTAEAVDPAGNLSGPSTPYSLTIITTPPAAPTGLTLLSSDDTGQPGYTSITSPHMIGSSIAGDTVELFSGPTMIGSAVAGSNGSFSIVPTSPLSAGSYTLTAEAVDPAGNLSGPSTPYSLTIITTPPAAPTGLTLLSSDNTGLPGYTSNPSPHLIGSSIAGDTVELFSGATMIGASVAGSNGSFSIVPTSPLGSGTYTLTAKTVDPAGNLSGPSTPYSLTVETSPPAAPTGLTLLSSDDTGLPGYTRITSPHLIGSSIAGDTVELFSGPTMIGSSVAGSNGAFSIVPTSPLSAGSYTLTAEAVDPAGNLSGPSTPYSLTIITTPPAAPTGLTLLSSDDSGQPGYTNVTSPHMIGSSIAGDTVELFKGSTVVGTAVAGSNGAFSVVPSSPLVAGTYYFTAKAIDPAGNISPSSNGYTLTVITAAPGTPGTPALLPADVTGAPGSNVTNLPKPVFTGTGPAGLTVEIIDTSNYNAVIGSAIVSSNGTYSLATTNALSNAVHVLKAIAIDAAGNLSSPSGSLTITVNSQTLPQPAPPSLLPADNTNIAGGGTTVTRPRLTGMAVPNGTIQWLAPDGTVYTSATVGSNGTYVIQSPFGAANGTYPVVVREVDSAGNTSPNSNTFLLTIRVPVGDYNGDGKSDLDVFNPTTQTFSIDENLQTTVVKQWGIAGDVPVQGDYYGNGETQFAVYRPSTSTFYVYNQATGSVLIKQWGAPGDEPITGDFFGDGRTDVAVFRPSTDTFYAFDQSTGAMMAKQWGSYGDLPVPGDYFNDGRTDFAVFRPSTDTFFAWNSATNAVFVKQWGTVGDIPVPADYHGNGMTDVAVFRPSTDTFYVYDQGTNSFFANQWGSPGDQPITSDYDGDGHADYAVYRPSTSSFFITNSGSNNYYGAQFGSPNNAVEPVLLPVAISNAFIARNANAGGAGTPSAASDHGGTSTADYYDMAIATPDDSTSSATTTPSTTKKSAHDAAIDSLSLERWRM